jgi:hypothetical protein
MYIFVQPAYKERRGFVAKKDDRKNARVEIFLNGWVLLIGKEKNVKSLQWLV